MSDKRKSGLAIFSLILGILSILVLGFIAAIPGIITGHMARSRAKNNPAVYGGSGMALAGLILSYLGLLLSIAAVVFMMSNPDFMEALQNMQQQAATAQ
jgi:hypothetical protein